MNVLPHRAETASGAAATDGGRFTRRGACPALSAPMQTGDGLLVRLNPVAAGLAPGQLMGLCEAAVAHGNGVIEVTARGSLQIRGLSLRSASLLAAQIDALGIEVRTGVPVQTGALAGLDLNEIADATVLAERIRTAIAAGGLESRLGPKVSVVVDGGGRSGLDDVAADVRVTAARDGIWQVAIAGDSVSAKAIGIAGAAGTVGAAMAVLDAVADMGPAGRARDLPAGKLGEIEKYLQTQGPALPPLSGQLSISPLAGEMSGRTEGGGTERSLAPLGISPLTDRRYALGLALPFGHTRAENLAAFARKAEALGVFDIRLAPKRTMFVLCPSDASAKELCDAAEALGFIIAASNPRTAISACPGAPACASGHIAARELASEIADDHGGLLDGSFKLHASGCAKGCAHPGQAALTLVGGENGAGLVVNGTARDAPCAYTARNNAKRALGRVATLIRHEGRAGEDAAATLTRLGSAKIVEAFGKE